MNALKQLQARWASLEARERRLVAICAALVGLALVWWIVLAPALKTLRQAPAEHARLDAQLQQMTTLQAQAKALQSQPRANRDEAVKASALRRRSSSKAGATVSTSSSAACRPRRWPPGWHRPAAMPGRCRAKSISREAAVGQRRHLLLRLHPRKQAAARTRPTGTARS